jgi:hypothetical protein
MRRNGEPHMMLWPKPEERRQTPRYPLERLAKIQVGTGVPLRYCLVIDISGGGVRINGYGFDFPDEFVLLLSGDGPAKDGTYRVIWRFATRSAPGLLALPSQMFDAPEKASLSPNAGKMDAPNRVSTLVLNEPLLASNKSQLARRFDVLGRPARTRKYSRLDADPV